MSTKLSFTRPLDFDFTTIGWIVWAVLVVYATANAVNLTDGLDGLAAGSSALTFSAFVIIAFTEFRHPEIYGVLPAQALDLAIVAAALVGACAGFLWWNAAPARIIMGDTGSLAIGGAMAGLALLDAAPQLLLPILAGLPLIETLSVIAQVVSYRGLPPPRAAHGADPPPLRGRRLVGVHGDRALLVVLRRSASALGVGIFYADFLRFGTRMSRALVIGLAATGEAVAAPAAVARAGTSWSATTRPAATPTTRAATQARTAGAERRRASRRRLVRARSLREVDLVVPSPLVRRRIPRSSPRAPRTFRCAARSTSPANGRACRSSRSPARTGRRR